MGFLGGLFWIFWVGFLLPTLLIDNEDFDTLPPRRGSHVDSACLTRLFQQLGFWVVLRRNLGRVSLEFELVSFATDTMHHSLDMAIGKRHHSLAVIFSFLSTFDSCVSRFLIFFLLLKQCSRSEYRNQGFASFICLLMKASGSVQIR